MGLLTEADVVRYRVEHYRLLARLLAAEPDADLLAALGTGLDERALGAAQVHRGMGEAWHLMAPDLSAEALPRVLEAYNQVFVNPYGHPLSPYESYYVSGRLYGAPLAAVRDFMRQQHLEMSSDQRREPEDALHCELATLATLAERQLVAGDAEPAGLLEPQRAFLSQHLLVWGPTCAQDLEAQGRGEFYRGVAMLLRCFLEVERDFFHEDGGLEVEPLEDARRRYHAGDFFKGEVYDPEQIAARKDAPGEGE